ncbi:MAG: FAD-dependent oxidoreductase [Planctomycetota bacterium]
MTGREKCVTRRAARTRRVEHLVIGAGPTGLGAATRLAQHNADFMVLESASAVGGLARSFRDEHGFTWDQGGHVAFSHYKEYDELFEKHLGGDYQLNHRESWVRASDTWVPYPFQNNIRYLPASLAQACVEDLERAQRMGDALTARNFGQFIDRAFGQSIARVFMRPYNEKVWAYPPETLNTQWIGERVAVIDAARARHNLEHEIDDFGWGPNNRFKYPIGGTGEFYDRLAEPIADRIALNVGVVQIDAGARIATLTDGSTVRYETLLSSMPLDLLVGRVIGNVPEDVRRAAARLRYSSGHMVGIGLKRPCPSTRSWMYFPGSECPFYRVTYLSNYSPELTPNATSHYSLLCETSFSPHRDCDETTIVESTLRGLEATDLLEPGERDDIVSVWHRPLVRSYPTPGLERDGVLEVVLPWLESVGISSRGRFGLWKYEVANTDHTLMQGWEWADRMVLGTPETTIGVRYESVADGRGAAVVYRSDVSGSGERRRG